MLITIADAYPEMDKTTFRLFQARIDAGAVTCTIEGWDRYNRALGICYAAGGTDLSGWLVEQGWTLAYRALFGQVCPRGRPSPGRAGWHLGGQIRVALALATRPAAGLKLDTKVFIRTQRGRRDNDETQPHVSEIGPGPNLAG